MCRSESLDHCSRYVPEKNLTQHLALAFWVLHYAKRILETFFVHRWAFDYFDRSNRSSAALC